LHSASASASPIATAAECLKLEGTIDASSLSHDLEHLIHMEESQEEIAESPF